MDLIAVDSNKRERFTLSGYSADFANGDENSFSVETHIEEYSRFNDILFLSVDKTEFGGRINNIFVDTYEKKLKLTGKTWRGMLEEKIIIPPDKKYYIGSGQPYMIMSRILSYTGLSSLFKVKYFEAADISKYQFERYCTVLEGFTAFLKSINKCLTVSFNKGYVYLSAEDLIENEIDNYDCHIEISKDILPINHLICLGAGELENREVLNLYLQEDGSIGKTQFYTYLEERIAVYDYPNCESISELEAGGIKRFEELLESESSSFSLQEKEINIGQNVTTYEHITGTALKKCVSKKILSLKNSKGEISYEVSDI